MITIEITGNPHPVNLVDGDNLTVTPEGEWASVRCNGQFVVVTPGTLKELQLLRQCQAESWQP